MCIKSHEHFARLLKFAFCVRVTVGVVSDTALAGRPGVSLHAVAASASATMPKEMAKDAVIPMHSISASLYVKGLTYQHILSVDMFTKEQVCEMQLWSFNVVFIIIIIIIIIIYLRTLAVQVVKIK